MRRPVEATLDLGTGCGVQALLAARHSEHVVGTDLNARALRLAQLNAALNGVENVEWRQGDLFEPVRDERFGLVAANPPFVVSPVHELAYRDGGLDGDRFSREALMGAARRLHEGGFATVLCSWITEPGGERRTTPRRWLEDSGCDGWVLELADRRAGHLRDGVEQLCPGSARKPRQLPLSRGWPTIAPAGSRRSRRARS